MTDLRKAVRRRTGTTVRDGGKRRRLIVTLLPSDVVGLRLEKTRRTEYISLDVVYGLAVKLRVRAQLAEKKAQRLTRRNKSL